MNCGTRHELQMQAEQHAERVKRIEARRFLQQPETPTGWGTALRPEDNLSERMARVWPRVSDVKAEEIAADARGEDLWLARGGEA
jgi:hypothetical protein